MSQVSGQSMDISVTNVFCSPEQKAQLQEIARSAVAGIWRIKRAKIILGRLEGKSVDRLILEVRVPPLSIIKCLQRFAEEGMSYFSNPDRNPTPREAEVESILAFLEHPPHPKASEWDTLTHRYVGIYFSARQIQTIRDLLASNPQYKQADLAQEVCTRFQLYQPNGEIRLATVCSILKRMDMDNIIRLPELPQRNCAPRTRIGGRLSVPQETMELDPRDIEELQFIPIRTEQDSKLWNAIIHQHHYIKSYRMFGARLRYLVYGNKRRDPGCGQATVELCTRADVNSVKDRYNRNPNQARDGHLLAVLGFAASAWRLSSRDEFIGWSEQQRIANLRYVVSNARFLILPWIKSPNLASRILGGIGRRLAQDWQNRYHYRPVLIETFVQLDRFTGTCYKAANWIRLGTTNGYSLYGTKQKMQVPTKAIFVYPLNKNFRAILCGMDS